MGVPFLPKTLKVHGRTFKIKVVHDDLHSDNMGTCNHHDRVISLNDSPEYLREMPDTICHELMHSMCYFSSLDLGVDVEERVVHVLASSIVQLFADNPAFGRWFIEAVKKL